MSSSHHGTENLVKASVSERQQLEKELEMLGTSFVRLQDVQQCFIQNISLLSMLKTTSANSQMLIPITGTIYIEASVPDPGQVLVDVGTGFLVEKSLGGADEFFTRKVKYVQEQLEALAALIEERRSRL